MQDLQNAVAAKFSEIAASGKIDEMIEKQLTETLQNLISGALRPYSDFGKSLDEQVKKALNVNFDTLGLPGYNDLILKIVRENVDANLSEFINRDIKARMAELLEVPAGEVKLSELIEQFKKFHEGDEGGRGGDEISLHIDPHSVLSFVSIDEDSSASQYSCKFRFSVDKEGRITSLSLGGVKLEDRLFVGRLHDFERVIFSMYAAGTRVIFDEGTDAYDYDREYAYND